VHLPLVPQVQLAHEDGVLVRQLDLRYEGRVHESTVPWEPGRLAEGKLSEVRRVFEEAYATRFGQGTARPESPLEVITFRVEALYASERPPLRPAPESGAPEQARKGTREVRLRPFGRFVADVLDFDRLGPGNRLAGPAIIERRDTTVFVPPGFGAQVDAYRNVRIVREGSF